ncbi:serine hydrolase [Streptomyces sp. C10-9-1]|uniref:serine hydrolase n=1 Tax=Streptomyces sp. C10-9-1 TaxID=1859285 RepID=UPI0021123313|nr:serine hydrolase [Streptomyces sp. C10-9-1]MCQ6553927.1 serine hydrolase [Streptomyces sp. C10-9-1]
MSDQRLGDRRGKRRTARGAVAAGAALLLATVGSTLVGVPGAAAAPRAEPPPPDPQLTAEDVDSAVSKLDGQIRAGMEESGVPGVAVAVVHDDRVVYLKGFGEREAGEEGGVSPDTVFQIASLSKPVTSTVIADAVGDEAIAWDTPVAGHVPGFALKDPWVSRHATVADLLSHRSGLPDHAGDLLEDLGYDQEYILSRMRMEPLSPFRASYAYTNFGVTAAAEAAADAKGTSWQELAEESLFEPAGMDSTSTLFADYEKAPDRAVTHVETADGTWEARFVRDPDAQAPAGGVSSTARDMAAWMRIQLANGRLGDEQIVPAEPLGRTHLPEIVSQPPENPAGRTGFYGLGWNVGYDDQGRLRLNHSGAFALGANTNVTLLPSERLGIVILTNGMPVGLADAIAFGFFDTAEYGEPTRDWLPAVRQVYEAQEREERSPTDYTRPPADAADARPDDSYTGTYRNAYYGPATVTADGRDGLVLRLGPDGMRFPLTPFDGDTFSFETTGENAVGRTGVTFTVGEGGTATRMTVERLDGNGLGTFTRD